MGERLKRDDVDKFYEYDIHIPTRTLYMGGEVDQQMAELAIKGITLLSISEQPITIVMNNPGGDIYHGLGIYDAVSTCKCHVTIVAYGHAMSMGSWILQAADERVLAPNCTLMMHYGYETPPETMTPEEVHAMSRESKRLLKLMEETYLKRMKEKQPEATLHAVQKLLKNESYMTARTAVELGLADKVLE